MAREEPVSMDFQNEPFNGDKFIAKKFIALRDTYKINTVIETGTFLGYTTEWLSNYFDKVKTIEIDKFYYDLALENRLSVKSNVETFLGDSSTNLSEILRNCNNNTIVFLDAHWQNYCPIKVELAQITSAKIKPIIVIHDFKVPDEPDLGFNTYDGQPYDYGQLKEDIDGVYGDNNYSVSFNSEKMSTGAKRGVIYIVPGR